MQPFPCHLTLAHVDSGNVVEFTMWNEMADEFEKADLDTMEQPIIIAVSSCRVSKYIGTTLLM